MIADEQVKLLLKSMTEAFRIEDLSIFSSDDSSLNSLSTHCIKNKSSELGLIQGMQAHVQLTKDSIENVVTKTLADTPLLTLTSGDIPILKELRRNLNLLNRQIKFLLDEGILILFLNLEELREKVATMENFCLQNFIQAITQSLQKLLKKYFVYQQFSKEKKRNQVEVSIDVGINFDHVEDNSVILVKKSDSELFSELQLMMNEKPTQQYINKYLENQMESIRQTEDTCRICSQKFKLQNIERHVRFCQKNSVLKQKLQQNKVILESLKRQAIQLLKDLNAQEKTEESQSLKRLITTYLKEQMTKKDRIRPKKRSFTMFQGGTEKSLKGKWQLALFQYQDQFGQNQFFAKIVEAEIEKNQIQKSLIDLAKLSTNLHQSTKLSSNLENMFSPSSKSINIHSQKAEPNISSSQQIENYDKFSKKDSISQIQTFLSLPANKKTRHSEEVLWNSDKINKTQPFNTKKSLFKKSNPNEDLPQSYQTDFQQMHCVSLQQISLDNDKKEISIDCFQIIKVLGKGAFGKVYLVRRKETEDLYALKIISISEDVTEKELQNIKTEHQIFKKIAGDHLVKAPFSFSQKGCHIFVMQLMHGGDLKHVLTDQVYFQEHVARIYLAEIVLAIEHLHQYDIIHRDLKPQNIVLDQKGHIKLTDFGLSAMTLEKRLEKTRGLEKSKVVGQNTKKTRRVAFSFKNIQGGNLIGTPDYIAPEIINHISTENETIDWWSLGVIAYEFLIGTRPFSAETIEEVIQNIHDFNIDWPEVGVEDGISAVAKDFIDKLLIKNFTQRLGANGVEEIKKHPFFEGIIWENIKLQNAPFTPKTSDFEPLPQDPYLRKEVQERVGSQKTSNKLKLEKFVRYDLLGTETIENISKIVSDKKAKLKRLKRSCTFEDDKKEVRFKSPSISNTAFI